MSGVEWRIGVPKTDAQVLDHHTIAQPNGCVLWTGAQNKGYGKLMRHGVTWAAHRFAWTLYREPIPDGLVIDHLCRTPLCVNVAHMEVTTIRVNTLRGVSSSAVNAVKTHCKRGHEFTPENIYHQPRTNSRECRTCKVAYSRARRVGLTLDEYFAALIENAA